MPGKRASLVCGKFRIHEFGGTFKRGLGLQLQGLGDIKQVSS